jgi:transcriptional regulator with XRE-family HTH domain
VSAVDLTMRNGSISTGTDNEMYVELTAHMHLSELLENDVSSLVEYDSVTMETAVEGSVNARIAAAVSALRAQRGLTLDGLANVSGVSRSALSLIERAESSPTAVVLDKIATGLGVPLTSLFASLPNESEAGPLLRRDEQPVWRDPGSGYLRRSVSPSSAETPVQIVEVTIPARARVTFDTAQRGTVVHQQLWVLEGTIDFTIGEDTYRLRPGDCLAVRLDRPTMFHNPTVKAARYAVVVVAEPIGRR